MSYRIAHVRFTKSGRTYPVNCHRRDLRKGDIVVVEMAREETVKVAELDSVEFLNWNCANSILGKRSEFQRSANLTASQMTRLFWRSMDIVSGVAPLLWSAFYAALRSNSRCGVRAVSVCPRDREPRGTGVSSRFQVKANPEGGIVSRSEIRNPYAAMHRLA